MLFLCALLNSGNRTWDALMDMPLMFDPIAGVGESLAAVATQVGLVLGVSANMLAHVFERTAGLAAEIAGVLRSQRIRVPTLGPNLADSRRRVSGWKGTESQTIKGAT